MASSTFSSSATAKLSIFYFLKVFQSAQLLNFQLFFPFQRNRWYITFLVLNGQPNETLYFINLYIHIFKKPNVFFFFWFDFLDWPNPACFNVMGISNHSNTYDLYIVFYISSSFSWYFLPSFGLLIGGSPLVIFSIYHQTTIYVISFWKFFGLSGFVIIFGIFLTSLS